MSLSTSRASRRLTPVLLAVLVLAVLTAAGALAAWLLWGVFDGSAHIVIDGEEVFLPPRHVGHWLMATTALLVVPAVILLGIALPLLLGVIVLGLVVLLVAGVLAVIVSPLLLAAAAVWGLWWWLRRSNPASEPTVISR